VSARLITNRQISVTNQYVRLIALLKSFMYKLNSRRQRIAVQVGCCGYLHLVDKLQTDRYLSSESEIAMVHLFITKSYK